jgi:restriction system protein
MRKDSLFAILLRSPWWISMLIALVLGALCFALLPERFRVVGAVSGLPFVVVGLIAARRQWGQPGAAQIAQMHQALSTMAWPAFASLLEKSFERDGYTVQPGKAAGVDFELEREGRRMLVSARRWKSARIGLEALRSLQAQRESNDISEALYVGLGEFSANALPFAAKHHITIWKAADLAHALRGLPLEAPTAP